MAVLWLGPAWAQNANTPPSNRTPNLGLYLPAHNSYNWDTWFNANFQTLDSAASFVNVAAKCDGVTDDTATIQAAIDAVPSGKTTVVMFPASASACLITAGLQIANKTALVLTSRAKTTIQFKAGTADLLYNSFPNFGRDSIFRVIASQNIVINNLNLDGNISARTAYGSGESQNSCLTLAGVTNVLIENNTLSNCLTDGVALVSYQPPGYPSVSKVDNSQVTIRRNVIQNNRRNNISPVCLKTGWIMENYISGAGSIQGTAPKDGIDMEPDLAANDVQDLVIANNTVLNNGASGIHWNGLTVQNIRVHHNYVSGNGTFGINFDSAGVTTKINRNVTIDSNQVSDNSATGIRVRGQTVDRVSNNTVTNDGTGIGLLEVVNLVVSGNSVSGNNDGITVGTAGSGGIAFKSCTLSDNVLFDNANTSALSSGIGYGVDAWSNDATAVLVLNGNTFYSSASATALQRGARFAGGAGTAIAIGTVLRNLNTDVAFFNGSWLLNSITGLNVQDASLTTAKFTAGANQTNNPLTQWLASNGNQVWNVLTTATGFNAVQAYRASDGAVMGQFVYAGSNASGAQWYGLNNVSADYLLLNSQNGSLKLGTGTSGRISLEVDNAAGNVAVKSGANVLYRCTTAGTLPVGAVTTTAGNCGATADTGLRVP